MGAGARAGLGRGVGRGGPAGAACVCGGSDTAAKRVQMPMAAIVGQTLDRKRPATLAKVKSSAGNERVPGGRRHLWPERCHPTFARVSFACAGTLDL